MPDLSGLQMSLMGPMAAVRDGVPLTIPASRKTRAMLGVLLLSPRGVTRQRLCDLFFDVPDDPRAAVRWSLSKLRPLVDDADHPRLISSGDSVRIDTGTMRVDVLALQSLAADASAPVSTLEAALTGAQGVLLADAELPDRPDFTAWLLAARQQVDDAVDRLTDRLLDARRADPQAQLPWWQRRIARNPLDEAAYAGMARALVQLGRANDADALLRQAERALRTEGLVPTPALRLTETQAALRPSPRPSAEPADAPRSPLPVIAVLPFVDISASPLPAYLAEGLWEGVTHALSRFKSLTVLARMSTAQFAGSLVDPRTVGEALGADLLVGASLVRQEQRLRIRWRAVSTREGHVAGSGDCDGDLGDVWALQEQAAAAIVTQIEPTALEEALRRTLARPTAVPAAWDLYLRGLHHAFGTLRQDYRAGLRCFEEALALDPDFHPAAAMAPWAAAYGNLIRSRADLTRFADMARRAVRGAGDDARTLAMAATAVFYLQHDFDMAEAAVERAMTLNPNEYTAWICGGWISVQRGRHEQAMARFDRAERLNPLAYAHDGIHAGRALSLFFAGELDAAEAMVKRALDNQAANPAAISTGVAIAARRGDAAVLEARRAVFLARYPEGLNAMAVQSLPFARADLRELFFSALKSAGVPG
jgi:TolB-like protein/Flp pilus assembly protein TadD